MEYELTWGVPVIWYLYLAGIGAGAVSASASVLLRSGEYEPGSTLFKLARYGALMGPLLVIVGTLCIIFELGRWDRAFNLFKVINLSPMSIGSWVLVVFITFSLLYALVFLPSFLTRFEQLNRRLVPVIHGLAWINIPLGISVAVYTGILLGAMPSRPFWNSPLLAFLFLISALSTGVAALYLAHSLFHRGDPGIKADRRAHTGGEASPPTPPRRSYEAGYMLATADALLIGLEIMAIFLFLMFAHLTVGNLKYAIAIILPGGEMAAMFWFWVVLVGLVVPGLMEMVYITPTLIYHREFHMHKASEIIVATSVLIGGFMLRYVVVVGGQLTGPMGI